MALKEDVVRCSFCNKTQSQVRKLIAGPNGAYICDECIEICAEIIEEEFEYENEDNGLGEINLLKPEEIKAFWMTMSLVRRKQKGSFRCCI